MKKIVFGLLAVAALFCAESVVAQSRTSYHMEGSYFRNELNPALAPTRGYIALPALSGVGVNMGSNWLSVDNFVYERDRSLVTAFHGSVSANEFLKCIPEHPQMNMRQSLNILGVGFYTRKVFWTFGLNERVAADFVLSKELFRAVKTLGNGVYDMGDAKLNATAYLDAYVGSSFPVCHWLTLGVKAKFLVGLANVNADFSQLRLDVGEEYIDGTLDGQWYGNAILIDNHAAKDVPDPEFGDFVDTDVKGMLKRARNFGAAFDLGAEARFFNDHLKISVAATDLGFICWAPRSYINGEVTGDFYFNGIDLETGDADADGKIDTDRLFYYGSPKRYTSRLNINLNAGVEYNFLRNHFAIGLLSHTEFLNYKSLTDLTVSFNIRPTNWLSATVSHTFFNRNRPGVFGAALNIHPCGFNFYVAADFIDPNFVVGPTIGESNNLLLSRYAKTVNVYAGIGFNFARPKHIKDADRRAKGRAFRADPAQRKGPRAKEFAN